MSDVYESDLDEISQQEELKCEAVVSRENFEKNLSNVWGYSVTGLEAKKAAMSMLSTKTGMYARIPLICKADNCPYSESCALLPYNLAPFGEPCPVETATIELRYAGYEGDFNLDASSFTDKTLISDLINHDVMLERCKALLNKEGVLVQEVFAGVTEQGEVFTRPEVSKHWEAYERIQKKRNDIYELMLATRKNKKGETQETDSLTKMVAEMVANNNEFVVEQRPAEFLDLEPTTN